MERKTRGFNALQWVTFQGAKISQEYRNPVAQITASASPIALASCSEPSVTSALTCKTKGAIKISYFSEIPSNAKQARRNSTLSPSKLGFLSFIQIPNGDPNLIFREGESRFVRWQIFLGENRKGRNWEWRNEEEAIVLGFCKSQFELLTNSRFGSLGRLFLALSKSSEPARTPYPRESSCSTILLPVLPVDPATKTFFLVVFSSALASDSTSICLDVASI